MVDLKTLKTYIETNLTNGFICLFKFPAGIPILFVSKLDNSLRLYINNYYFNNFTIKNQYLLPLIRKLLNQLD